MQRVGYNTFMAVIYSIHIACSLNHNVDKQSYIHLLYNKREKNVDILAKFKSLMGKY